MLDTIRLRLYGILDTKNSTLDSIHNENGRGDLYAVPEHNELYLKILKYEGKNFSQVRIFNRETRSEETTSEEEFIKIMNSKELNSHYQMRSMMRFINEEETKDENLKIYGKYRVRSDSTNVNYSINERASYIDFEFSIPKYLYGHSLAEFIPQQGSELKFFKGDELNSYLSQGKYLYRRLMVLIEKFLTDLCKFFEIAEIPNMRYIEIRRLDLCYNQHFESKEAALAYLAEQRKLVKRKNIVRNKNLDDMHETTVDFHTGNGSYFKIYHKGTEYSESKSGDLKKHLEINKAIVDHQFWKKSGGYEGEKKQVFGNPEDYQWYDPRNPDHKKEVYRNMRKYIWQYFKFKGEGKEFKIEGSDKQVQAVKNSIKEIYSKVPYKINFLKNEMDKVLRYEVSLSTKFFMYAYKRKVFRRDSEVHKHFYNEYKLVKNQMDKRTRSDKKLSRQQRNNYKMFHDWLNRKVCLIAGRSEAMIRYEEKAGFDFKESTNEYKISRFEYASTILASHDVGFFSEYFLKHCITHFWGLVQKMQINEMQPETDVVNRIKEYNASVQDRLDKYNEENVFRTLDKFGSQLIKGTRVITKASQLLTQKELREKGLKKVNVAIMATLVNHIKNGKSFEEICHEMKLPSSTKSRYKMDLEMFGVNERTLSTKLDILVKTDFSEYYFKTDGEIYRSKFFTNPKHFNKAQYNWKDERFQHQVKRGFTSEIK